MIVAASTTSTDGVYSLIGAEVPTATVAVVPNCAGY